MRVLRTTLWRGMNNPGLVTVNREDDFNIPVEAALEQLLSGTSGTLTTYDLFEMADGGPLEAAREAGRRTKEIEQEEMNQSVLYFWVVKQWQIAAPGATLLSDKPAPLSVEQIKVVLEQLARHPEYNDYTYIVPAQDGTLVGLQHGQIRVLGRGNTT